MRNELYVICEISRLVPCVHRFLLQILSTVFLKFIYLLCYWSLLDTS